MNVKFVLHKKRTVSGLGIVCVTVRDFIRKPRLFDENGKRVIDDSKYPNYRRRLMFSLGLFVEPDKWDAKAGRLKARAVGEWNEETQMASVINKTLQSIEDRIRTTYFDLLPTPEFSYDEMKKRVVAILRPQENLPERKPESLVALFDNFLVTKRFTAATNTIKKFRTAQTYIVDFEKKYRQKVLTTGIDATFADRFTNFLLHEKGLKNTSVNKFFSLLGAVATWGGNRGYEINTDFKKREKLETGESDEVFLTEEELFSIYNHKFENSTLQRVADIFCFQTFTGQRWSDVVAFRHADVRGGIWYRTIQKTKKKLPIPLSDYAVAIMEKYRYLEKLPTVSAQKNNEYLKKVCRIVGTMNYPVTITKQQGKRTVEITRQKWEHIGSHTARRSFITISFLRGMSIKAIMGISGHSSLKMINRYISKAADLQVAEKELKQIWRKEPELRLVQGKKAAI